MSGQPSPSDSGSSEGASLLARRFTIRLLVSTLAVVAGCALFNAVIDPYGLFRWIDRTGFNEIKPRAVQRSVAFKYRAIDFISPNTVLLGNSRAEMGWDPGHLPEARFGKVVNAGLPGTGLAAMIPVADHAWARSRPAILLIGVEFFDCLEDGQPPAPHPPAVVPWASADAGSWSLALLGAFASETISLDATLDSLQTLAAQRNPYAANLRRDGFQPGRDYVGMQAIEGPRKLFLQRDIEYARARMNGPKAIRYANGQLSECFASLDQLIGLAQRRGQAVYLATYPYHARLLELIADAGLWQAYEEWKKEITDLVAARRRTGLDVSLRDFGAYHRYAIEPISAPVGKASASDWYWESGHFRPSLGARMLDVMLGKRPPEGLFGVELSPAMIATHLGEVRKSRAAFIADQPAAASEMRSIARRACRRAGPAQACPGADPQVDVQ